MKNKQRSIPRPALRGKVSILIGGALAATLLVVFVVSLYQRINSQGAYRNEYEGRVMDKWVTYHETELGTRASHHLLIKAENGEVFQVSVSPELYEQGKVNTWVIKNKDGVKFLTAEP